MLASRTTSTRKYKSTLHPKDGMAEFATVSKNTNQLLLLSIIFHYQGAHFTQVTFKSHEGILAYFHK